MLASRLLDDGFRPFFLGTAWYAALHALAWIAMFTGRVPMPHIGAPAWHAHEMVFGVGGALLAGFLLTAVPRWTGRDMASRKMLAWLMVAWLVARVAWLVPEAWPLAVATSAAFIAWLAWLAARPVVAARNRRNYGVLALIALFVLANWAYLAALFELPGWSARGAWLAGLDALLVLMVVIGARIVPFFTSRKKPDLGAHDPPVLGVLTTGLVISAVAVDTIWRGGQVGAWLALAAGLALCLRIRCWRPLGAIREPMLWILHAGFAWIVVSLLLRGGSVLGGWLPISVAVHALAIGGIGCLALGIMSRASLGHSGRPIAADKWILLSFILVAVAAVPRIAYPLLPPAWMLPALAGSVLMWSGAFLVFGLRFLPVMFTRAAT